MPQVVQPECCDLATQRGNYHGKAVIRFDDVNDFMEVILGFGVTYPQPRTLFFVMRFGPDTAIIFLDGRATPNIMDIETSGSTLMAYAGNALNATGQDPENFHIYAIVWKRGFV